MYVHIFIGMLKLKVNSSRDSSTCCHSSAYLKLRYLGVEGDVFACDYFEQN
jgi:hypothetical protein